MCFFEPNKIQQKTLNNLSLAKQNLQRWPEAAPAERKEQPYIKQIHAANEDSECIFNSFLKCLWPSF